MTYSHEGSKLPVPVPLAMSLPHSALVACSKKGAGGESSLVAGGKGGGRQAALNLGPFLFILCRTPDCSLIDLSLQLCLPAGSNPPKKKDFRIPPAPAPLQLRAALFDTCPYYAPGHKSSGYALPLESSTGSIAARAGRM